ncbi:MAG: N-glycosylase/DNA lyase [Candidatus Latescibacterota bacterium]|jgi:N-glycosylase/DNA lyase
MKNHMKKQDNTKMYRGVLDVADFELGHTLGSGQCFRWGRDVDGWWKGIAYGVAIHLKQDESGLQFCASSESVSTYAGEMDLSEFLRWYLRLDEYPRFRVSLDDKYLRQARDLMKGLRFVRQDPFECIISYVLSVQAHMTLTKRRINLIARTVGHPVDFDGKRYWAFPIPDRVATLDGQFFRKQRFGWRSERVADSAGFVAQQFGSGDATLAQWRAVNDALLERSGSGVGLKVAKCIDLFSLERLHSVPVDTWVRKFAESWYGVTGSDAKICKWGEDRWGKWAGYCNEYLFSYYRELHGGTLYDKVLSFNASDEPSAELPFDMV